MGKPSETRKLENPYSVDESEQIVSPRKSWFLLVGLFSLAIVWFVPAVYGLIQYICFGEDDSMAYWLCYHAGPFDVSSLGIFGAACVSGIVSAVISVVGTIAWRRQSLALTIGLWIAVVVWAILAVFTYIGYYAAVA